MRIEHFAVNVAEPRAMAEWYCAHMGMTIKRRQEQAPHTHFLADEGGSVMIEIYHNPPAAVPDYARMNPLRLHLAFVSANPAAAGASERLNSRASVSVSRRDSISSSRLASWQLTPGTSSIQPIHQPAGCLITAVSV
jgi:hypothetical protein